MNDLVHDDADDGNGIGDDTCDSGDTDSGDTDGDAARRRVPEHMFEQFLDESRGCGLRDFHPFATASERESWLDLPEVLREAYRLRAVTYRDRAWPQLTMSGWNRYFRDGNRREYESVYGDTRRRLVDDTLAYCVIGDGNHEAETDGLSRDILLADIIDGVTVICDHFAWQVPAHNSYVRDAPQLPWPDPDRPVLDLFACETGQTLAAVLYLLGEDLPEPIRRRVMNELSRRIITPYLHDRFWWMGYDGETTNNWTTWCTQNVLATVLLAPFDDDTRHEVIVRALFSLDRFLDEYGDDGGCVEGASYYHAAGLCLYGSLRMLTDVQPDVFSSLWHEPKIVNIATYISKMRIASNLYFNFSDCSVHAGFMGAREFLFAKAVGDDAMAHAAATEWRHTAEQGLRALRERTDGRADDADIDVMTRMNMLYMLFEAQASADMLGDAGDSAVSAVSAPETLFTSTGIAIARGSGFDVALKADRNGASHSHNDTGSVIVYRDDEPVFIDVGVGTYTRLTFSPQRYTLWPMQSSWHNLPDFDGVTQRETPDCHAESLTAEFSDGESRIDVDLTHAWPAEAKLAMYRRRIILRKNAAIDAGDDAATGAEPVLTIHDTVRGGFGQAVMHLMLACEPRIESGSDGCRTSDAAGHAVDGDHGVPANSATFMVGKARVTVDGLTGPFTVEPRELDDAALVADWGPCIWRLSLPFADSLTIGVR